MHFQPEQVAAFIQHWPGTWTLGPSSVIGEQQQAATAGESAGLGGPASLRFHSVPSESNPTESFTQHTWKRAI